MDISEPVLECDIKIEEDEAAMNGSKALETRCRPDGDSDISDTEYIGFTSAGLIMASEAGVPGPRGAKGQNDGKGDGNGMLAGNGMLSDKSHFVYGDHSYSMCSEASPLQNLLHLYQSKMQKSDDAAPPSPPLSDNETSIFHILEGLGIIMTDGCNGELISDMCGIIEGHTNLMKRRCNTDIEHAFNSNVFLTKIRDLGHFLVDRSYQLAEKLKAAKAEQCTSADGGGGVLDIVGGGDSEYGIERKDLEEFKTSVARKLIDVNIRTPSIKVESSDSSAQVDIEIKPDVADLAQQTDPDPERFFDDVECQTDALETEDRDMQTEDVPAAQSSGNPSQSEGQVSSAESEESVNTRKKRRKKKRELIKSFFENDSPKSKLKQSPPLFTDNLDSEFSTQDKEIQRLLNFNNLDRDYDQDSNESTNEDDPMAIKKGAPKRPNKEDTLMAVLNGIELQNLSTDENDSNDGFPTEAQFLKDMNLAQKEQLLQSSSDESSISDSEPPAPVTIKTNPDDSGEESMDENAIEQFLSDRKVKEEKCDKSQAKRLVVHRESLDREIEDLMRHVEENKKPRPPAKEAVKEATAMETVTIEDTAVETFGDEDSSREEPSEAPLDLTGRSSTRTEEVIRKDASKSSKEVSESLFKVKTLESHTMEQLDMMVQRNHGAIRNPLIRDPDCISLSSESGVEELGEDGQPPRVSSVSSSTGNGGGGAGGGGGGSATVSAMASTSSANESSAMKPRQMRKMLSDDQLDGNTKKAQRDEAERIRRLDRKHDIVKKHLRDTNKTKAKEVILDVHPETKKEIKVHPNIVVHLKQHQIEGLKFVYDCSYGSVADLDKYPGSGCILAHCMGLGKTLQLISLLHTVIQYPELKTNRILVLCPKSTVMNWVEEIERWLGGITEGTKLRVFFMPDPSDLKLKIRILRQWHSCGKIGYPPAGVLLLGHEAFRILALNKLEDGSSEKTAIDECLLKPGADLVVCDEGHVIKNPKSAINKAVTKIRSVRRIILTGTPIQNNLKEYYCMVNFIKPLFLGTLREFCNLYVNPIRNGQHKDSTRSEIKCMQQRSYVLHKKLERFVQRREAAILKQFLPEKFEYVIFVPLTPVQERLYEFFLKNNPIEGEFNGRSLISDYTFLRKIWTHPKVLENAYLNAIAEQKKAKEKRTAAESDDEAPDDVLDRRSDKLSVTSDWWREHLGPDDLESLYSSNKLRIMFEILKLCRENGEKCLIFSAFVAVLNVVEFFMSRIGTKDENATRYGLDKFEGPWEAGRDYYRLDGKTSKLGRHAMITRFNDPKNTRVKCFLISAKAGGMGINLIGASRVIILDTSWNPSNDQQNIFRIFRLGQKRNCFVYRLLAMGTMEEKVYSRSVTKQALSFRVVDEQQIDRHYSMAELAELYVLSMPDFAQRPVPIRPTDNLLANLVHSFPRIVFKYHIHDSLLENKPDEDLSEAEKQEAWLEYEKYVATESQTQDQIRGMMNPAALLGVDNMLNSLTHGLALYNYGPYGMPAGGGMPGSSSSLPPSTVGPSSSSNLPFMLMNQRYGYAAADPMFMSQLYGSAAGAGGPLLNPNPAYPSFFTNDNGYYTSGSLFPDSTGLGLNVAPSGSGAGVGGIDFGGASTGMLSTKGGSKGKKTRAPRKPSALQLSMNQMQSLYNNPTVTHHHPPPLPPLQQLPFAAGSSTSSAAPSTLTPNSIITSTSSTSSNHNINNNNMTVVNTGPGREKLSAVKNSITITPALDRSPHQRMAGTGGGGVGGVPAVPSSTTIERLPMTTTSPSAPFAHQQPPPARHNNNNNGKDKVSHNSPRPAVDFGSRQDITLEKISKGGTGSATGFSGIRSLPRISPAPTQKPNSNNTNVINSNNNSMSSMTGGATSAVAKMLTTTLHKKKATTTTNNSSAAIGEPTEVINLIDDVVDRHPGLTVKTVSGRELQTKVAETAVRNRKESLVKNVNMGIKYPPTAAGSARAMTKVSSPLIKSNSALAAGTSPASPAAASSNVALARLSSSNALSIRPVKQIAPSPGGAPVITKRPTTNLKGQSAAALPPPGLIKVVTGPTSKAAALAAARTSLPSAAPTVAAAAKRSLSLSKGPPSLQQQFPAVTTPQQSALLKSVQSTAKALHIQPKTVQQTATAKANQTPVKLTTASNQTAPTITTTTSLNNRGVKILQPGATVNRAIAAKTAAMINANRHPVIVSRSPVEQRSEMKQQQQQQALVNAKGQRRPLASVSRPPIRITPSSVGSAAGATLASPHAGTGVQHSYVTARSLASAIATPPQPPPMTTVSSGAAKGMSLKRTLSNPSNSALGAPPPKRANVLKPKIISSAAANANRNSGVNASPVAPVNANNWTVIQKNLEAAKRLGQFP